MDGVVQTQAQEGSGGGGGEETYAQDAEVPESYCRSIVERHFGKEEPETRS